MTEQPEYTREQLHDMMTDERCDAARMQLQQALLAEIERNMLDLPFPVAIGVSVAGLVGLACYAYQTMPPRLGATEADLRRGLHEAIDGMWEETRQSAMEFTGWPTVFSDAANGEAAPA
ncbi:hypothetical protein FHS96_004944 [Sphingomonas zeicaulis]|uniref:hypothetical protein n=1 Tax=Sphingomonas zeicaulis TaxID=1632740 RepID=UPI003D1B179A